MTTKYYALLTNLGAAKLANAAALGTQLQITQMAVGDGGGTLPTPNATQTKLIGEKRRAALNSLSIDAANSSQIIAEQVIPESEGGFWIREIGLFDADGVLIAVANCAETYKPQLQEGSGRTQTVRMILIVSSTDAVTLKIDPSIVLATRQYVDNAVIEVKAYADDLMAKHVAAADPHTQYAPKKDPTFTGTPKAPTPAVSKNDTQIATTAFAQALFKSLLSSDTNNSSEILAATPKAIKAVNDAAFKLMGNIASGVDFNTLGPDKAGRWGVTTTAATTNANIPEAALGYLDVIPYGSYGCTHRFTARSGNEYERYLTANWNGTSGPWSDWLRLGEQPYPTYFDGDMNTLTSPCTISVTGNATGGPLSTGLTGILTIKVRLSTNSVVQRFTAVVPSSSVYHNRTWERVMSTTWGPWAEQVTMSAGALPSTSTNLTGPMLFGFDGANTDQSATHQPIAGEVFGGLAVPRGLRPAQFGVSGRGVSASFWFRGFNNAASDLTEWKQVITSVDAASLTAKGIVKLSNATDSVSQELAATPKAVSDAIALLKGLLGSAAGKDVGTGTNQIPDMNSFAIYGVASVFSAINIAGRKRLMEGNGSGTFSNGVLTFTLPLAFGGDGFTFIATDVGSGVFSIASIPAGANKVTMYAKDGPGNAANGAIAFKYLAVGPV